MKPFGHVIHFLGKYPKAREGLITDEQWSASPVPPRSLGTPRQQNAVHGPQAGAKTTSAMQRHSQTLPAAGLPTPPSLCPPVRLHGVSPHLAAKYIPSSSCSGAATSAVLCSCKVEPPRPSSCASLKDVAPGWPCLAAAGWHDRGPPAKAAGPQGWGSQTALPSEPSLITSPADLLSLTPVP